MPDDRLHTPPPPDTPDRLPPFTPAAASGDGAAGQAALLAALAQLDEGVIVADPLGRITFVNDAAARLHGGARLGVAPAGYTQAYQLLTEDGRPYPPEELPLARAALRGEAVAEARWRVRRPDGTEVLAVGSARPLRAPDGTALGAVLTVRDDTARAAAAAERDRLLAEAAGARARLGRVLAQTPAAVGVLRGPDHVVESVNEAFLRLLGRRDYVGRPAREGAPELVEQGFLERLDEVYRTGVPFAGREAPLVWDRDGRGVRVEGYFDFVYQPIVDAAGAVEGVLVFAVDVTAAVRARREVEALNAQLREGQLELELSNQQLQEQAAELEERTAELARARDAVEAERARLARVVAQLPAALAVFEGPELVFRGVSAAYQRIIGGREVLGRPIREALPELSGGGEGPDFFALLEGVYATGEAVTGTNQRADWDDNGDGVAEAHQVDLVYAPLRGAPPPGEPPERAPVEGVTALVLDVSARAHAEAAVRESEARFRNVADAAPVMLWVTEADGRCTFLNRAWLDFTGQTLEEGLGLGWLDAVHPDDAAAAERVFLEATARGGPFRVDYRLRRADGQYRRAVDAAAPRLGPGGEFLGFVGSVVDVEERARLLDAERAARAQAEQARADAEEANRAKGQFLANMSHELRTPLNAIAGYVQLLDLELYGAIAEPQREALQRVRRAQEHLLGLITDVLNYAKLESGRVEYDLGPVDLRDVVADVAPLVGPQLAARGVAFELRLPDGPQVARADRERVGQVLLNLLSNAVKFTDAGGRVRVEVAGDPGAGRALLTVADTGRGIAADKLDAVFEPFVQLRPAYGAPSEGTGLGLSISRDLARGMGGELLVESEVGVGSRFTLALPAA